MTWAGWSWLTAFIVLAASLVLLGGCSHAARDLELRQRAVQDCILTGGHAHLGPGNTILCD